MNLVRGAGGSGLARTGPTPVNLVNGTGTPSEQFSIQGALDENKYHTFANIIGGGKTCKSKETKVVIDYSGGTMMAPVNEEN